MPQALILKSTPFLIPANCFNRVRLLQLRSKGSLEFGLPGLPGHHMVLRRHHWQCWNRPLRALLMTWHDFRIRQRDDLDAPVACTLSVHHPYSRTVIHRIHDSIARASARRHRTVPSWAFPSPRADKYRLIVTIIKSVFPYIL